MSDIKLSHEAIALIKSLFIKNDAGVTAIKVKFVSAKAYGERALNSTNGLDVGTMLNKCLEYDEETGIVSILVATIESKEILNIVSNATITPDVDLTELVTVTALAVNTTLANPTGSPVEGQKLVVRIKDNATSRTITYGTEYRAMGVALPGATTVSKTMYLHFIYNATDTKWDLYKVSQQA